MDEVGESELLDACLHGRVLDCLHDGSSRTLAAAVIRRFCLADAAVDPHGLRVRNAMIVGTMDLAGLSVPFPLRFESCQFDSAPVVEGARLDELALTGCGQLPGLLGNGVQVRRDLDLSRSMVTGAHRTSASTSKTSAIWLCESDIGGRLLCVDTSILSDGERSVQADRMRVGGTVRLLQGFTARGEVRLLGARIGGSLDLVGARITSPGAVALDLGDASIDGSVFIIGDAAGQFPVIKGRIAMGSTRIAGQLLIRDLKLSASRMATGSYVYSRARTGSAALSAARLSVGAEVTLEGRCEITGGLDLTMSEMSGLSIGRNCSLRGLGGPAIDLTNAELKSSVVFDGSTVAGTLSLRGARIHGDLSLQKVRLRTAARWAVSAQGSTVDGDVLMQKLDAAGGPVEFRGATLRSLVNVSGARLDNPAGYTLSLHHASVRGSVQLVDIESSGLVVLTRALIEGRLDCTGGRFTCPRPSDFNRDGHALIATSAVVRGGMELDWRSISPSLDLTNATTTYLADDPGNWPDRFTISGFSYDRFEQSETASAARAWDHGARIEWLSKQASFDAGPYQQAAAVYRQHGHTAEAENILIAQRRRQSQAATPSPFAPRRLVNGVYDATVGYGYRPERVLWIIAALLVFVGASLQIPEARATLRASDAAGDVYSTAGLLRLAQGQAQGGAASAATPPGSQPAIARNDACGDGQVRCFSPVLYAIDTVIPLVSLDQRSTWYPDPHQHDGTLMQWWLNVATLLGWLLSSIFVLSLARFARSP